MYSLFNLDKRANQYVFSKLRLGHTLANEVLRCLNILNGKAFTLIPELIDKKMIYSFKTSCSMDSSISDKYLLDYIYKHVTTKNYKIILENSLAKVGDAYLKKTQSNKFFFEKEVYHLIDDPEIQKFKIEEIIDEASNSWQNVILFYSDQYKDDISINNYVGTEEIKEISKNIEKVVVDAYDLEGYIFWEKI